MESVSKEISQQELSEAALPVIITSVVIVSVCSIVYELLISTLSSYLLGNSVLHFSLTIGLFMFFMGVGSYLSKYIHHNLVQAFVWVELLVGLLGGSAVLLLYLTFAVSEYFYPLAFVLIAAISICIGFELPIATRIVKQHGTLRESLAHILSFDYLGALAASILFPLVFLPYLGLMKTGFIIGALNVSVAILNTLVFRKSVAYAATITTGISALILLTAGFFYSVSIQGLIEDLVYEDPVILTKQTPYQKIVLTRFGENDLRMYLDGNLQFSTADEYRYHETLIHYPISALRSRKEVLILGAGDGMAVRELLKYDEIEQITLVDLDREVVKLATTFPLLKDANKNSLADSRVNVIADDAYSFMKEGEKRYDLIVADLPDPNNVSLGKLYSAEFYRKVKNRLNAGGIFVTQASSPFFAREAYWCVEKTLSSVFEYTRPFRVNVPSFGEWGFVMASDFRATPRISTLPKGLAFLNESVAAGLEVFPQDLSKVQNLEINKLDNQALVRYYEQSLF